MLFFPSYLWSFELNCKWTHPQVNLDISLYFFLKDNSLCLPLKCRKLSIYENVFSICFDLLSTSTLKQCFRSLAKHKAFEKFFSKKLLKWMFCKTMTSWPRFPHGNCCFTHGAHVSWSWDFALHSSVTPGSATSSSSRHMCCCCIRKHAHVTMVTHTHTHTHTHKMPLATKCKQSTVSCAHCDCVSEQTKPVHPVAFMNNICNCILYCRESIWFEWPLASGPTLFTCCVLPWLHGSYCLPIRLGILLLLFFFLLLLLLWCLGRVLSLVESACCVFSLRQQTPSRWIIERVNTAILPLNVLFYFFIYCIHLLAMATFSPPRTDGSRSSRRQRVSRRCKPGRILKGH